MALGQFGPVGAVDQRDVSEPRQSPVHGLEDLHLPERVGQVIVAADDVRNPHVVIVHHNGVQIRGSPVAAQDDHVIHLGVGDADGALHQVLDHCFAFPGRFQPDGGLHANRSLRRIPVPPTPIVARRPLFLDGLFPHLPQFLGGAVAIVGFAGGQQRVCHLRVTRGAGRLEYRLFVAIQSEPVQAFEDHAGGFVGGAFPVGVLHPQQKRAVVVAAIQEIEQRGAGAADMQQAGGAGGEAGAYGHAA